MDRSIVLEHKFSSEVALNYAGGAERYVTSTIATMGAELWKHHYRPEMKPDRMYWIKVEIIEDEDDEAATENRRENRT